MEPIAAKWLMFHSMQWALLDDLLLGNGTAARCMPAWVLSMLLQASDVLCLASQPEALCTHCSTYIVRHVYSCPE